MRDELLAPRLVEDLRHEDRARLPLARAFGLIMRARKGPLAESYAHEREAFVDLFSSEDQREGVNAFLAKRSPQWRNA